MTREIYVNTVLKHIKNKSLHAEIRAELENHIAERMEYYTDCGYDGGAAEDKAIEKMGDANETGKRLGKLNNYPAAVAKTIISFTIYLICVFVYAFSYKVIYAIISPDPSALDTVGLIVSCAAFIAGAVSLRLIYKHSLAIFGMVYGAVNIIVGLTCWWLFNPIAYGIIGFFTSFIGSKGHLLNGSPSTNLSYIQNESISNILYYVTIGFIMLFMLYALASGIMALKFGVKLYKNNLTEKDRKKANQFSIFFLILAIFGVMTTAAEITVPAVQRYQAITGAEQTLEADAKEVTAFVLEHGEMKSADETEALLKKYGFEYKRNENMLTSNLNDNFVLYADYTADGEPSIFSVNCNYKTVVSRDMFDESDISLTPEELIKKYGFEKISQYHYQVSQTDGKIYQDIMFSERSTWELMRRTSEFNIYSFLYVDGVLNSQNIY